MTITSARPGEDDDGGGDGEAGSADVTVADLELPSVNDLECSVMGIQIQNNVGSGELLTMLDHVNTLNLGWVKIQANWSFLEP